MTTHLCVGSDHLLQIAASYATGWAEIWAQNRGALTRNPNLLFKGPNLQGGDRLTIPTASSANACTRPTDHDSTHQVSLPRFFLRLRLLKRDFTPAAGARYSLLPESSAPFTGHADAHGRIEIPSDRPSHPLSASIQRAILRVWLPAETTSSGTRVLHGEAPVTWDLNIGALNPILEGYAGVNCLSGIQQRLNNLGFECGAITGTMNPQTDAAISEFQRTFGLNVGGRSCPDFEALQIALRDVHDQPNPSRRPAPASASRPPATLSPAPSTVGHVALDFDPNDPTADTPRHFNTLMVRPQYRISLQMGKIEELFPDPTDTWKGKAARSQVLGLFYFPLEHGQAQVAQQEGWWWVKREVFGLSHEQSRDDAAALRRLAAALDKRVISGATPPPWTEETGGGLPPAAANPRAPQDENFAKIRIPGGYTPTASKDRNLFTPNDQPSRYGHSFWSGEGEIHQAESHSYLENVILGKIPLIARVERWNRDRREWERASNVDVHFQLVAPYDLPAVSPFAAPPVRASAVADCVRDTLDAQGGSDPQRGNFHHTRGGKRGIPVANSIFRCTPLPGFNGPHDRRSLPDRPTAEDFFPQAQTAVRSGSRHLHAVRARTNRHGEAGVIFMPSRCGGDRYRIRAYVDPANHPDEEVAVETGTLVVWRNIRMSRVIRHRPRHLHPQLLDDAAIERLDLPDAEPARTREYVALAGFTTAPDGSLSGFPELHFSQITHQLATAYCELECDRSEEELTESDWSLAHHTALYQANSAQRGLTSSFNLEILFPTQLNSVRLTPRNIDSLLPMRTPDAYNRALPASGSSDPMTSGRPIRFGNDHPQSIQIGGGGELGRAARLVELSALPGFLGGLSGNGFLPGLTLVTTPAPTSWHTIWLYKRLLGDTYQFRGSIVFYGEGVHQRFSHYPYTVTCIHELGHLLFRTHARGRPGDVDVASAAENTFARHQNPNDFICVMSYSTNQGDFCGKCLLALRGCVPP